jgi:hypothetical protein
MARWQSGYAVAVHRFSALVQAQGRAYVRQAHVPHARLSLSPPRKAIVAVR